jgi:hypothetical protein
MYADNKGPYILQSEAGKSIKMMMDKNTTEGDISGNVLKLFGKDGFRITTQMTLESGQRISVKLQ